METKVFDLETVRSGGLHTSAWRPTHFHLETYRQQSGLQAYLPEQSGLQAYHTSAFSLPGLNSPAYRPTTLRFSAYKAEQFGFQPTQ
eukprot:5981851-Amphidinium_carterae.1